MIRVRRQVATAGLTFATAMSGSTAAMAYWTVAGRGDASTTIVSPSVSITGGSVSGLYPGATQTVQVTVANENAMTYQVSGVTADVSGGGGPDACPRNAFRLITPSALPAVPPREPRSST